VSDTYSSASEPPYPQGGQQPAAPEYLEAGSGSPLSPETPTPAASGGGRRRGLLIGGGIAALAVIGVGAWAAAQFFSTGAQPAEALPASTIGYASIDLDPSGAQKIEALRTLNKFPAFKEHFGLDAGDDIRESIFEELDVPQDCQLFYKEDIEPWLGSRFAVAAVDLGDKDPAVVGVLQVKDADAADAGLTKIRACGSEGSDPTGGWVIDGDWAILAESDKQAQAVVDAADKATLADDPEFQELTSAAGSAGIATMYAAPEAGKYFGDSMGQMSGLAGDLEQGLTGTDNLGGLGDAAPTGESPLSNFKGMAATVRFDNGALEIEGAGDSGIDMSKTLGTGRGGDVVETLPAATAVAFGMGFDKGWLTQLVEQVASFSGGEMTADDLFEEASAATGLDLPQDGEALFGESAALMFGSDFDPEAFFNSGSPSDIPIAMKVKGDDKAAIAVLEKILAQQPDASKYLGLDSDAGYFAIGPGTELRTAILGNGELGKTEVYQDVIRESDKASAVLFVNFNAGDDWLVKVAGDDPTVAENLKPLAGFGIDTWQDDDWTHGVLRITTD
jgi:hypothetical protein